MSDNNKEEPKSGCCGGSGHKCGGCKFLAGLIVGLLLAGAGFGLYMAGRSRACQQQKDMCPFMMRMGMSNGMMGNSTK